MRIND